MIARGFRRSRLECVFLFLFGRMVRGLGEIALHAFNFSHIEFAVPVRYPSGDV